MHPRTRRHLITLLIALSFVAAIVPRWALSHRGLPYEHHWDEPAILNRAIAMAKTGDLNPHFFNYGSLSIYLSLAAVSATYLHSNTLAEDHPGAITSLRELTVGGQGHPWFISHPRFLLTSRWVSVFFGVASCMALLGLGFMFQRPAAGAIAALLLGASAFHSEHSAYLTTDIPASTCALFSLAIAAIALHQRRSTVAPWLLAGALCGFATSFKYNMAGITMIVVVAILLAQLPASKKALAGAGFAASLLLAFFVGAPYALLDLPAFLRDAGFEIHHYAVAGHENADILPGLPHLLADLGHIATDFGFVATALGLLGGFLLVRQVRGSWVLVAGALLQLMLTASTVVFFPRNVILVYPIFALCAGAGAAWGTTKLRPTDSRRGLAVWTVLVVLLVAPRITSTQERVARALRPDSRTEMVDRVNAMDRSPKAKVHLARELLIHPSDLARLDQPFAVAPLSILLCRRLEPDALRILPLRLASVKKPDTERIASLNSQLKELASSAIGRIGGRATQLHIFSVNPVIGAWAGGSPIAPDDFCIEDSPLKLSMAEEPIAPGAAPLLLAEGEALTGQQEILPPGSYQLEWCHQSTGETASSLLLTINGEELDMERTMRAPTSFCRRTSHQFTVSAKGPLRFSYERRGAGTDPIRISPPSLVRN